MARNRITELFKKTGDNITQRIKPKNSRTEIMPNTNQGGSAVTWIMDGTSDSAQVSPGRRGAALPVSGDRPGDVSVLRLESLCDFSNRPGDCG